MKYSSLLRWVVEPSAAPKVEDLAFLDERPASSRPLLGLSPEGLWLSTQQLVHRLGGVILDFGVAPAEEGAVDLVLVLLFSPLRSCF